MTKELAMDDRKKALAAALSQIEKQFGKGSIMKMGEGNAEHDIRRYRPARWASISRWASAVAARGRVVEIYGPGVIRQNYALPERRG